MVRPSYRHKACVKAEHPTDGEEHQRHYLIETSRLSLLPVPYCQQSNPATHDRDHSTGHKEPNSEIETSMKTVLSLKSL